MVDQRWRASAEERAEEELVNEILTLQDDQQHADLANGGADPVARGRD
jgi:hypothetical protein